MRFEAVILVAAFLMLMPGACFFCYRLQGMCSKGEINCADCNPSESLRIQQARELAASHRDGGDELAACHVLTAGMRHIGL